MYIKSNFIDEVKFVKEFDSLKNTEFSFFFDYRPTMEELNKNPINIFAHDEPNEYFGNHDWLEKNAKYFSLILTWNVRILNKLENSRLLIFGESWIDDIVTNSVLINKKDFCVSFIRGNKLLSTGHLLRHQIFNKRDEINIPTDFYSSTDISTFENIKIGKLNAHKNSMFSLVIENTSHHNYFTEKLTDPIMCNSLPLYWGCTNIEKYYDERGIIKVHSDDHAIEVINTLKESDYYDRIEYIKSNRERAICYNNYIKRIKEHITDVFVFNKII